MNHLVAKTTVNGQLDDDRFQMGLLEWRNTPHEAHGLSPAEILFGHPMRTLIPTHRQAFAPQWQSQAQLMELNAARYSPAYQDQYNGSARALPPLAIGTEV